MLGKMRAVEVLVWALLLGMADASRGFAGENEAPDRLLQVGDPAPPLQQGRYVQGEPVAAFESGKVYVVEFWSTWCGPCRAAIPHLNQLHEKYKDRGLVVIGQNGWERGIGIETSVTAFVAGMGSNMAYRVALDDGEGSSGKMAATWWKAAGCNRIPMAFVVDQAGRIAWIGHPLRGLDEAVEKVLTGTHGIEKNQDEPARSAGAVNAPADPAAKAVSSGTEERSSYEERRRQRMLARQPPVGPPPKPVAPRLKPAAPPPKPAFTQAELEAHLQEYQKQMIRDGLPPLPIALTPESEAQLAKEGFLPPYPARTNRPISAGKMNPMQANPQPNAH